MSCDRLLRLFLMFGLVCKVLKFLAIRPVNISGRDIRLYIALNIVCKLQLRLFRRRRLLLNARLIPPGVIRGAVFFQRSLEIRLAFFEKRRNTLLLVPATVSTAPPPRKGTTYPAPNIWQIMLDSSRCASSGDAGPRHISARFSVDAMGLTFCAISVANSSARGSTAAGSASDSANSPLKCGEVGGNTAPVETRYMALEKPISRGRKYDEHDSMVMPRRPKTKPYLDALCAMRTAAGSTMVMPTPTAEPCIAAMVGLRHLWMARATRPPLEEPA